MGRLHIHAGFHKTGTTSLQSFLKGNRRRLSPHVKAYLKSDFPALSETARDFSQRRTDRALDEVARAAKAFWATLRPDDAKDIILSSEDLSGHLPGRQGVADYSAAAHIMKVLSCTHAKSQLSDWELVFYFTTRNTHDWAKSCYAQHVRITRMSDTLQGYLSRPEAQCDLARTVSSIRDFVAPTPVRSASLEDLKGLPFGPVEILLDAIALNSETKQKLRAPLIENAAPPSETLEEMRQINASEVDNATAATLKRAIRLPLPEKTGP